MDDTENKEDRPVPGDFREGPGGEGGEPGPAREDGASAPASDGTGDPVPASDGVGGSEPEGADGSAASEDDRRRVQNRRAAWAVAIMALISLVLVGSVILMYCAANKMNEPDKAATVVSSIVLRSSEILYEIEGSEPADPFYVLLIGSDSRKGTALYTGKPDSHAQVDQHGDVLTLMRVDPVNYIITLVTVPRDTQLEGDGGKICDALAGGDPQEAVAAVEELTGADVSYYMMTGFIGFEDLVDDMGGLRVDVPCDLTLVDPKTTKKVSVTAGESKLLDGSQALVLARAREEYGEDQDAYRQVNVRNLIVGMIERAGVFYTPERLDKVLDSLSSNVKTDMDERLIALLARDFMENQDLITFYSCSGPYEGDFDSEGLWVVPEDDQAWGELMAAVDSGADPTTVAEPLGFAD